MLGDVASHFGNDEAGGYNVHSYVAGTEFFDSGFGESNNACFGSCIVGLADIAADADYGTDIDDAAEALFPHGRLDGLCH